ncbi:MAG: hypothetical protein Q7Q71_10885 [Verrucomicrobiota bacterium JB023]|nr:hypothetical protein [Verrucomicrobiota bacterium JB023]
MKRFCLLLLIPGLLQAAGEHSVTKSPFTITETLEGLYLPAEAQEVSLSPKQWKKFVLTEQPEHGSTVAQGDSLLSFDKDEYDQWLAGLEDEVKTKELQLAISNRELTELKQKNELTLARAKEALDHAESDLKYFLEVGLPAEKEDLAFSVKQRELSLAYEEEELKQLKQMYEEDDLTEETEEIILVRQQNSVESAKFSLAEMKRRTQRSLEAALPRKQEKMEQAVTEAQINYATAKGNLERKYNLKAVEVSKAERELELARKKLAEGKEDGALFEQLAEMDGRLYFGEFEDGRWKKGDANKYFKVGGTLPLETVVLTVVPTDAPLTLNALVDSETAAKLSTLNSATEPAPLASIASWPDLEGKHLVTIPAAKPEPFVFAGSKGKTEITFYKNDEAITIPKAAIKEREDGTRYVRVKLSEGDPEERVIQTGQENGDLVEVVSGLEEGQVILH